MIDAGAVTSWPERMRIVCGRLGPMIINRAQLLCLRADSIPQELWGEFELTAFAAGA